jgi:hypothetical protein
MSRGEPDMCRGIPAAVIPGLILLSGHRFAAVVELHDTPGRAQQRGKVFPPHTRAICENLVITFLIYEDFDPN